MERGLYRKLNKGMCYWCYYQEFPCESKKINHRRACIKCRKEATKNKKKNLINDID